MTTAPLRLAAAPGGSARPIGVLVADRHPLFREGLARAVRQRAEFQLAGEAADGRSALERIQRRPPDVAVVDVDLPGITGTQLLNAVVRDRLPTHVLLVAATVDPDQAYRAVAAGAAGLLSKQTEAEALRGALRTAAAGDVALAPAAQTGLAAAIRRRAAERPPILSEREQRVLLLVADGRTTAEIASAMRLATGTVKDCLLRLYERFGVSERAALVALALRRGLIR